MPSERASSCRACITREGSTEAVEGEKRAFLKVLALGSSVLASSSENSLRSTPLALPRRRSSSRAGRSASSLQTTSFPQRLRGIFLESQ